MSDRPLQAIQDTLRVPLYGTENIHNDNQGSFLFDQLFLNAIPQFHIDSSTETKEETVVTRPGVQKVGTLDFLTGIVNSIRDCTILDAIPITAVYDVFVLAVFDDSNDTIYIIEVRPVTGSATKIGSFAPTATLNDYCYLTEITQSSGGSALPAVAVSWTNAALTASKGYYAISSSGVFPAASLTEITHTGFPPKQTPALISIGRFVWLNGVSFIASVDGRIWNSTTNGNDITVWSNGVIAIQAYPDQCVGLARYKHHIVAFGRTSVEFFNDVGDTPCPLQSTQQAFIKFGAKSSRVIRNVNDVLYWISYGDNNVTGLWQLDGYTPVKLSHPAMDNFISGTYQAGNVSAFNMQVTTIYNKPTLILNGIQSDGILTMPYFQSSYPTGTNGGTDKYALVSGDFKSQIACYNIEDKTWWTLQLRGNSLINLICAGSHFATPTSSSTEANYYTQILFYQATGTAIGTNISQQYVYKWPAPGYSLGFADAAADASDTKYPEAPITSVVQMNTLWFGNQKRKRINKLNVIGWYDRIGGSPGSEITSLYLFYVKDNVPVVSSAIITNMQVRGVPLPEASKYRTYFNNLGMGRAWSFCLVHKAKEGLTYKALELDIQQGSH